jgi:hypothetical protein
MRRVAKVLWLAALVAANAEAQPPPCAYSFGLVARTKIDVNGNNLYVDSFDSTDPTKSTNGRYDVVKKQPYGNVAVGVALTNSVTDSGNANIYGFIFTGPSGTVTIGANGSIGPTFVDASRATDVATAIADGWIRSDCFLYLPDAAPPSGAGTWLSLGSINNNTTLNSGDYVVSSISLAASKTLTINGNVRLYITGNTITIGNGMILISSNASLTVYSAGNIFFGGNGVLNHSGLAIKNRWFGLPSCTSAAIAGNGPWIGTVYAPEADMTVYGNGDLSGATVANSLTLGSNASLHYDESLNVKVCSGAAINEGITGIELAGSDVRVRFPVAFFRSYTIEYRDELATGNWASLVTTNTESCTGEVVEVIDPGAGSRSQRFYRLRIQPQGFNF